MTLPDIQQQRLLERLRRADGEPVTFAELRVEGIAFPAATVSELALDGFVIDRVYRDGQLIGVRLLERQLEDRSPDTPRRRPGWRHR